MNPSLPDTHAAIVVLWGMAAWITSGVVSIAILRWASAPEEVENESGAELFAWMAFGPAFLAVMAWILAGATGAVALQRFRARRGRRRALAFERAFRSALRGMSDWSYRRLRKDVGEQAHICVGCQTMFVPATPPSADVDPIEMVFVCSASCGAVALTRLRAGVFAMQKGASVRDAVAAGLGDVPAYDEAESEIAQALAEVQRG